ncbi:MAG: ATPase, T2SS/T4P/T4SS family [Clostridiaceae bacterium]
MNLSEIIIGGLDVEASDIHFIPFGETTRIFYRIRGVLLLQMELETLKYQIFLQKIKANAQMNISEKRLPQDGILRDFGGAIRVSTLRSIHGESLVLRLFPESIMTLEETGLSESSRKSLTDHLIQKSGISLISGETGMGKSTTLYAIMMMLRDKNFKVISIEDPVEREIEGIVQSQINDMAGLSYEKAIFAALRQDPDYIAIGEIRNKETANALIRSALTGHKVISTIHAHGYLNVKKRMMDFGIREEYLETTLNMVMSQRLQTHDKRRVLHVQFEFPEDFME